MSLPPFQSLLDQHAVDVHHFLIRTVGRQAADDCYQETWLAALRAYPNVRRADNLRGWLFTIAHNKAIDHLRKDGRRELATGEVPERAVHDPELTDSPWPAVAGLPPKQRVAVALRYALDSDFAAVASAMGISEDAARRNVHEGLKRLRKEYEHDGFA